MDIMTVRDAIESLKELDPDLPFVLSSDEEGNNIRIVNGIGESQVQELLYNFMESIHPDDIEEYESPEDYAEDHGLGLKWQPIKVVEVW